PDPEPEPASTFEPEHEHAAIAVDPVALEVAGESEPDIAEPAVAEAEAVSELEVAPELVSAAGLDVPVEPEVAPDLEIEAEPAIQSEAVEPEAEPEPEVMPESVSPVVEARARFHVVAARAEAEALIIAGDRQRARPLLLRIAEAEREAGRLDAAIDACLILVTIDPADTAVQLELATIQAARGWTDLARDKITLLTRLAGLDEDSDAQALVEGSSVVRDLAGSGRDDREPSARA
ncbi:MAG: hypothetical protein ABI573_01505, partial [Chloroflexota bacterium]